MRTYQDRHLEPVFSIYLKYLWEMFGQRSGDIILYRAAVVGWLRGMSSSGDTEAGEII